MLTKRGPAETSRIEGANALISAMVAMLRASDMPHALATPNH
jgi:hypothetical protein